MSPQTTCTLRLGPRHRLERSSSVTIRAVAAHKEVLRVLLDATLTRSPFLQLPHGKKMGYSTLNAADRGQQPRAATALDRAPESGQQSGRARGPGRQVGQCRGGSQGCTRGSPPGAEGGGA